MSLNNVKALLITSRVGCGAGRTFNWTKLREWDLEARSSGVESVWRRRWTDS